MKVGDVVALRSGGPKMTVAALKQDRAYCIWFNRRDQFHEEKTGEFSIATLKPYHQESEPNGFDEFSGDDTHVDYDDSHLDY